MKTQEVKEINSAFQKYFRASKRIRIHERNGAFIVVDDRDEAVDLIRKLFISRDEKQEILSAKNVSEAQLQIDNQNNGKNVKAVVIDLGLDGNGKDGDGLYLAEWLSSTYPSIPFVFSTGKEKRAKDLIKKFPGVDVFIKGKNNLYELAEALGLNVREDNNEDYNPIPKDPVNLNEENCKEGVFSFVKGLFSL